MVTIYSTLSRSFARAKCFMFLVLAGLLVANDALSSVVMVGTRVIYPGDQRERIVQLINQGGSPSIVQIWVDAKGQGSSIETAESPFFTTPQIFRVEPNGGQVVRLIMADKDTVPQDRESVFYLSFSQLPGSTTQDEGKNRLTVVLTSRVKIFYRPSSLPAPPGDLVEMIQVTRNGNSITAYNPTPFHVSLTGAQLQSGSQSLPLKEVDMIAPFSSETWTVSGSLASMPSPLRLRLSALNDFGAQTTSIIPLP